MVAMQGPAVTVIPFRPRRPDTVPVRRCGPVDCRRDQGNPL